MPIHLRDSSNKGNPFCWNGAWKNVSVSVSENIRDVTCVECRQKIYEGWGGVNA